MVIIQLKDSKDPSSKKGPPSREKKRRKSIKTQDSKRALNSPPSPPNIPGKAKGKIQEDPRISPSLSLSLSLSLSVSPDAVKSARIQDSGTMIQSCFSNPSSPATPAAGAAASSQSPQSLVTSIYQTHLLDSPAHLTLTWSRTASSHMLTIHSSPHLFSLTISLQPPAFSLFRTRPGSKSIHLAHHPHHHHHSHRHAKIKVHWDFTRAEFARGSAEPEARFYLSLTCNGKLEFYLGDLDAEPARRHGLASARQLAEPTTTLLSRREHVFGSRVYACTAQFLGSKHEISIECSGGVLKVKVDGETSLVVKRLAWKFRGNERITVGGTEVDFFWDVLNWVGNITGGEIGNCGYGVFVFQVGDCGVIWPEMIGPEKKLMRKSKSSLANPAKAQKPATFSPASPSCSSVLQWAEESGSSDGSSRSSCCSSSTRSSGSGGGGFSLMVYAWRSE